MVSGYGFSNPWDGVSQGYELGNALRVNQARQKAGQALQGGDYDAASNALLGAGDLNAGLSIQKMQAQQAEDARKAKKDADAEAFKFTADAAGRLQAVAARYKDDPDRANKVLAAFDMIAPAWRSHGETDQDLADIRAKLASDPDLTLSALGAGVKKYQLANGGDGYLGSFDPETGNLTQLRAARPKPLEMDPEKTYYLPDTEGEGGGVPAPPRPPNPNGPPIQADGSGLDPDVVWKSIHAQESGGDPTPGDAVGPDTAYGNALGSTQMLPATAEAMARKIGVRWDPRLMRENSPQALEYQDKLGRAYFDEGLQRSGGDVGEAAAYYFGGPDPKMHGPKTRAYVQQVLDRAGRMGQPYQVASAGPTPPAPSIPGYRVVQTGRPHQQEWVSDGNGNLVNQKTGDRKIDPTAESALPDNLLALTGPALLNAIGGKATTVKALSEGRMAFPTGMALSKPYWQQMLQLVGQYDPTFDAANPNSRVATRKDFTSGKSAQNITALNTVIGHLDHLDQAISNLNNIDSELGPLSHLNNSLNRSLATRSNTDARYKDFETAKSAVANELTRVFRGSGGAEADIQDWMKKLDSASGPRALHEVVRSMATLIQSRIDALGEQYTQGMGTSADPIRLLTPDKQKSFDRMMAGRPSGASSGTKGGGLRAATAAELALAKDALAKGIDRAKVIQRMRDNGIDPRGI